MAYDVLVIGGGPAGLSAAQNVRARGKTALVVSNPLEENPLWKAKEVDNYLGLPRLSGAELLTAFQRHAESSGAEFLEGRALSALRSGESWYVSVGNTMVQGKAVVLAAGVVRGKKLPGEAELLGRGVSYCATCDGMLYRGKRVAVLGWTPSAEKEAAFLEGIGCQVLYLDKPRDCAIRGAEGTCFRAWRRGAALWRWTGRCGRTSPACLPPGTAPAGPYRYPRPWARA